MVMEIFAAVGFALHIQQKPQWQKLYMLTEELWRRYGATNANSWFFFGHFFFRF